MKAASQAKIPALASGAFGDYWALSKPRVTLLVWGTTLAGAAVGGAHSFWLYFHLLVGSWFVIASANALNQVLEIEPDSRMKRTMNRPLPSGRLSLGQAMAAGIGWSAIGVLELAFFVNTLTAALGAISILMYVFAYTPLKRKTYLSTMVGAIPGAIPPLAGYVAARNEIGPAALLLFAIQYFWQFPHFWSIAWLLRADYRAAGFKMLPFAGADGKSTGLCCAQYSLALLPLTGMAVFYASSMWVFGIGAGLLALWMAGACFRFWRSPSDESAKRVLKTSVLYLPLLLILIATTWK